MWKWTRKNENKPEPPAVTSGRPSAAPPTVRLPSQRPLQKISPLLSVDGSPTNVTHIGKSIVIKGELSGSENVYLDGKLEGSIELLDGDLTVGPNGDIHANLRARNIAVEGRVNGNLHAIERVELKKSADLVGDICTQRIAIEDGAQLKGSVLVNKGIPSPEAKKGEKTAGQ